MEFANWKISAIGNHTVSFGFDFFVFISCHLQCRFEWIVEENEKLKGEIESVSKVASEERFEFCKYYYCLCWFICTIT